MFRILSSFSLRPLLPAAVITILCLFACRQQGPPSNGAASSLPGDTTAVRQLLRTAKSITDKFPDSAMKLFDSSFRMSVAVKDTWSIGMSYVGKGIQVFDTGNFALAKEFYSKALVCGLAIDSFDLAAKAATSIGNTYLQTGPPDSAVKSFMYALELSSKAKFPTTRANTFSSLSIAFTQLELHDKSLEYTLKAEADFRRVKDTANLIRNLINQGSKLEYPEAIPPYLEAIALSDKTGFQLGQFYTRLGVGDMYITAFKYDSAQLFLRQAEDFDRKFPMQKQYRSTMYAIFGRLYYMRKQYPEAREYFSRALKISGEIGKLDMLIKQYRVFTKVNILLGLKDASIDAYEKYNDFRDSMQGIQVSASVSEMETKYRTAEKDAELARKELDLTRQQLDIRNRNTGLYILSGILVLLLGGGIVFLILVRQKQQLAAQKMLTLAREAELEKAQAAMEAEEKERARIARNLHDGAGSILSGVKLYLSSLENQYSELAGSNAYRDTVGLLNEAVTEIRETSHNLLPKILHLDGLHAAIRDYCGKLERNESFELEFHSIGTPQRYNGDFELMAFRTFQELISNVIKHADASHVIVQLSFRPGIFSITVEDDGKGMNAHKATEGIGMFGIRTRVAACKGSMDVDSSPDGTSISLEFPVPAVQFA